MNRLEILTRTRSFNVGLIVVVLLVTFTAACNTNTRQDLVADYQAEILATELAFARLAGEQGIKAAFLTYAADDAVLNRNNRLVRGKQEIAAYFDSQTLRDIHLEWKPDYISVSAAGDLGYTYGSYTFSAVNSQGETIQDAGIFHSVWRRGTDGKWRYVWD